MLLRVDQLRVSFRTEKGVIRAVDGVSFELDESKTLGIVGESGCGKSVTALSLTQLLPMPPAQFEGGEILFENQSLIGMDPKALSKIRGAKIGMIFQEPMTSLNPVYTLGNQIAEGVRLHFPDWTPTKVRAHVIQLLKDVGISDPENRVNVYPHQLSGGMRQRVMIAIALSCRPKLIIADEPTTALDVTIQAQILDLLRKLRAEYGTSLILISHNLGVVAEMVDEVMVMYAGKAVEKAPVRDLFEAPLHPYTQGLMRSIPTDQNTIWKGDKKRLSTIPGSLPDPYQRGPGCLYHDRCPIRVSRCEGESPPLEIKKDRHFVSCFEVQSRGAR